MGKGRAGVEHARVCRHLARRAKELWILLIHVETEVTEGDCERGERRRLDILELESAFNGIAITLPSGRIHLTLLRGYKALSCLNSAFQDREVELRLAVLHVISSEGMPSFAIFFSSHTTINLIVPAMQVPLLLVGDRRNHDFYL